jgi:hypothetical protein
MKNKQKDLTSPKSYIPKERIAVIKSYEKYSRQRYDYEKYFSTISEIQNTLFEVNQDKSKFLKKFINNFVLNLSKAEIDELY